MPRNILVSLGGESNRECGGTSSTRADLTPSSELSFRAKPNHSLANDSDESRNLLFACALHRGLEGHAFSQATLTPPPHVIPREPFDSQRESNGE